MDTLLFASRWGCITGLPGCALAIPSPPCVTASGGGGLCRPAARQYACGMIIGAGMQLVYLGVTSTPGAMCRQTRRWRPVSPFLSPLRQYGPEPGDCTGDSIWRYRRILDQLRRTLNAAWVHMADKHGKRPICQPLCAAPFSTRRCWAGTTFPSGVRRQLLRPERSGSFLKLMPHWLTHSFEIMGGISRRWASPSPLW